MLLDVDYGYGDVKVVSSNPIPMIAWSDMQKADIISVGGNSPQSYAIRTITWSGFSHTALYAGNDYVIESLLYGPTRNTKAGFLDNSGSVLLVHRHNMMTAAVADRIIRMADDNINDGAGQRGKNPKNYDWFGLGSGGMSTTGGKIINDVSRPFTAGIGLGTIWSGANKANKFLNGQKASLYCSEGVVTWYSDADIPITFMPPDEVPPAFIGNDHFPTTLSRVGYLRYM